MSNPGNLILYPADETAFLLNGLGVLSDATDAEVYEELNGQFELTVKYPITGIHFAEIQAERYISAKPDPETLPQPFRIYRITKPLKGIVTIYARHNAYRNKKILVAPFSASSVTEALSGLKSNAVNDCPFAFSCDFEMSGAFDVKVPTDIWTLLGSSDGGVLDVFGGEWQFSAFSAKLMARRGEDRGVTIRYGKNLTDMQIEENTADYYTGVYPYWTDSEGNLVQLYDRYVNVSETDPESRLLPLDLSGEFEEAPTQSQLLMRTKQYVEENNIGKRPVTSMTVEFVQLEQTEEYRGKEILEQVRLGDSVYVYCPSLDIYWIQLRAVAVRYNPLLGRYKNITLGKVKSNLASTILKMKR